MIFADRSCLSSMALSNRPSSSSLDRSDKVRKSRFGMIKKNDYYSEIRLLIDSTIESASWSLSVRGGSNLITLP